ncbi:hypothetical protein KAJ27_20125, partial [bacterium]|nr:hypothetical protein [bacterium]
MTIQSQKIKGDDFTHLYFPLAKLGKNKSIFADSDKKIFADKYKSVMESIIGKQLALNTYYANDLIAAANTKITVDLLIIFDNLKINFKVNFNNITEEERNTALDLAMGEIIQSKKQFWEDMQTVKIPQIQTSVKSFISNSVSEQQLDFFDEYYSKLKSFVEMANNVITSEKKYEATAVAIKKTIDTEQKIFNLPENAIGETIEHVIKTTQIALLIAG